MAKAQYLLPTANVTPVDTFADWVDTTNQLVYDMGSIVLTTTLSSQPNTAVGGYTVGNAHVQGILSANTIVVSNNIRGGSTSTGGDITIVSNTIFNDSDLVTIAANTENFNVFANTFTVTSNSVFSNLNVINDVAIGGNLSITGSITNLNIQNLEVSDKTLTLGAVAVPTDTTANTGGLVLKGSTDKTILWEGVNANWSSSEHWNLASGKVYRIGNTQVLSATALGSSVVSSSLTSVGTITSGTWNGSTIAVNRGGTGQTSYANGQILIGDSVANTLVKSTLTAGANITITNASGSITISASPPGTDLSVGSNTGSELRIDSSTGNNVIIPVANSTVAGIVTNGAQTIAGAKTFTSTIVGSITGNAGSASILETARTITLTGDVGGVVSFNGSGNVSMNTTIQPGSIALGTDTTGNYVADITAGSFVTKTGSPGPGWSPTISVSATSVATPSTIVSRDASGNFSANTITANLSGNATTASTLQTARTITLTGDVTGSVSFNGSSNVTLNTTILQSSIDVGDYVRDITVGTYLVKTGTPGTAWVPNISLQAATLATPSTLAARDSNGNMAANNFVGNASTASALQTARTISLTGDVVGSVSFSGSGNVSIDTTIQPNSVALGTDTTGNYVADITAGSFITKTGTAGEGAIPTISVSATSASTASTIVARDASGNFSAGTITASLSGNASTASTWLTARTFTIGGTGKSVNGSGNVSWSLSEIGAADSSVTITAGTGLTGGGDLSANRTISVTGRLLNIHNISTTGIIATRSTGVSATRTITAGNGITVANGDGDAGNPTITLGTPSSITTTSTNSVTSTSHTHELAASTVMALLVNGSTLGAVGTYALLYKTTTGAVSPGSSVSGSALRYSNADEENSGTPSGTWRAMGYTQNGGLTDGNSVTLYFRIA